MLLEASAGQDWCCWRLALGRTGGSAKKGACLWKGQEFLLAGVDAAVVELAEIHRATHQRCPLHPCLCGPLGVPSATAVACSWPKFV